MVVREDVVGGGNLGFHCLRISNVDFLSLAQWVVSEGARFHSFVWMSDGYICFVPKVDLLSA